MSPKTSADELSHPPRVAQKSKEKTNRLGQAESSPHRNNLPFVNCIRQMQPLMAMKGSTSTITYIGPQPEYRPQLPTRGWKEKESKRGGEKEK